MEDSSLFKWKWDKSKRIHVRIENLVYTTSIYKCDANKEKKSVLLNLQHINKIFKPRGSQYNKRRFAAVILRYRIPKLAQLIFAKGKIVCTGGKEYHQARKFIQDSIEEIKQSGYGDTEVNKLEVQNIVASTQLPWRVDREKLSKRHPEYCNFFPDIFPGVIIKYKPKLGDMCLLLFDSGKMVFTGAKDYKHLKKGLKVITPIVRPCFIDDKGNPITNEKEPSNIEEDESEEETEPMEDMSTINEKIRAIMAQTEINNIQKKVIVEEINNGNNSNKECIKLPEILQKPHTVQKVVIQNTPRFNQGRVQFS